jgi:hypothetical protein
MTHHLLITALLLLAIGQAHSKGNTFTLAAATSADNSVSWQEKSILSGDFTCHGKREYAILGTKPKEIVIAVFRPPAKQPVDILRYVGDARSPELAILTIESLDFDIKEMEQYVGSVPNGLQPSKTCLGLNMTDQMIDSAHIYWHRKNRRFESWSL